MTFIPRLPSIDAIWELVTDAIVHGRPVAASIPGHAFVIKGYVVVNGARHIIVNDPAHGIYRVKLDIPNATSAKFKFWTMPAQVTAKKQEPGVKHDSDGDKVVDFDETQRFHTDPAEKDTDVDDVNDKQDIASGVFDEVFGYAFLAGRGRDYDSDGVPTETDPDSDSGGCDDGDEDENGDGHQTGEETWNFDSKDDVCGDLSGTITWTLEETSSWPVGSASSSDSVTLNVRFDEKDGEWVDAGSSYSWTGTRGPTRIRATTTRRWATATSTTTRARPPGARRSRARSCRASTSTCSPTPNRSTSRAGSRVSSRVTRRSGR